jgi:tRNA(Ile)-lysidine synthase
MTMSSHGKTIPERIHAYIREHRLLSSGERLLLSLSAGKDSVALLDIMSMIAREWSLTIGVFHLNHLSRGAESDADERFVRDLALAHKLRLYSERFDCTNRPKGYSFEEFSRETRYRLLNRIAGEESWDKIVTAHTGSDNAETVLMRIMRGTGIHGLRGIEPIRGKLIRPLLPLTSGDVYRHLAERKLQWREDASNSDTVFLRNFVRSELLPLAGRRFPAVEEALRRLSKLAIENTSLLDHLMWKTYGKPYDEKNGEVLIHTGKFGGDERCIKHALGTAIRSHFGQYISSGMIDEIIKTYRSVKNNIDISIGRNLSASIFREEGGSVIIIRKKSVSTTRSRRWEYRIVIPGESEPPGTIFLKELGCSLSVRLMDSTGFPGDYRRKDVLFLALPQGVDYIILRIRLNGDRIRLPGGTKKIKDLLIDLKIARHMRDVVPVLTIGPDTTAVMTGLAGDFHHRVASDYMVTEQSQKILAIYRAGGYTAPVPPGNSGQ